MFSLLWRTGSIAEVRLLYVVWGSVVLLSSVLHAQPSRQHQYRLEAGTLAATSQTPFWLRANQYGIVPLSGPLVRLRTSLGADYQVGKKTFFDTTGRRPLLDWGYAVEAVANVGATTELLLPEVYLKGRLGAFELYAGRRREVVGLVDTLLTTGAYAWSGNALPIPKIQIGLYQYTPVPLTKGIVSFLGAFAHGWFDNRGRLIKGSYLHHKYLYGRLGKPTWPFRLYGGFNHQVIWGGKADPGVLSELVSVGGQLPTGPQYFSAVVFGSRGQWKPGDPNTTTFEDNRIGNHLGSLDVGFDLDLGSWNVYGYRQFLYDDGSLFYGTNMADGLNGLRLKNRRKPEGQPVFLHQLTLEYLYTESQGGGAFIIDDPEQRGRDDYFNHSQFIDGWTHLDRTIGTPFFTPAGESAPTLPQRQAGIVNNRVRVGHFGLSALIQNRIDITTRLSVSRNLGTYNAPYPGEPMQFSGLISAALPVPWLGGTTLSGTLALDAGGLLPGSVGGYVALRKTGLLK
jgi:hypothetical protein